MYDFILEHMLNLTSSLLGILKYHNQGELNLDPSKIQWEEANDVLILYTLSGWHSSRGMRRRPGGNRKPGIEGG